MGRERPRPRMTSVESVVWRYSNYDTPLWALPNTRAGRWHAAGELAVQYFSLEPNGAWAELIRAEGLTSEFEVAQVRMPLWAASLTQGMLADYTDFDRAEAARFPPEALIDDDWERCQHEGDRLRDLGFDGVMAPSAALDGAVNVTVFGARITWDWNSTPAFASAVQTTMVAVGSPPPGLVAHVRRFGEEHEGFGEFNRIRALAKHPRARPDPGS